jgi:hypothetical protein
MEMAGLFYKWWVATKLMGFLILSCQGARLVCVLSFAIHISPNNGLINMFSVAKLIYYVPPIHFHFACSIIQIGLLVAKLQHVTGMCGW